MTYDGLGKRGLAGLLGEFSKQHHPGAASHHRRALRGVLEFGQLRQSHRDDLRPLPEVVGRMWAARASQLPGHYTFAFR